jgi:hypothetical protein
MGRAKYYDIKGDYEKAMDSLNTVTVLYSWFLPAVIEKARIAIKSGDWDQGIELARKVLDQDTYDIESLRILVLEVRPIDVVAVAVVFTVIVVAAIKNVCDACVGWLVRCLGRCSVGSRGRRKLRLLLLSSSTRLTVTSPRTRRCTTASRSRSLASPESRGRSSSSRSPSSSVHASSSRPTPST